MAKPLTIDDIKKSLLPSIAELFETHSIASNRRFTKLDQKFTQLDQKVTGLDQKFTKLDQKVTGLDQKFTQLDQKVTGLDQKFHEMNILFEQSEKKIDASMEFSKQAMENTSVVKDHSKRIRKIESEVEVIKKVIKSN